MQRVPPEHAKAGDFIVGDFWSPDLALFGGCQFCNRDFAVKVDPSAAQNLKYSACTPCLKKIQDASSAAAPKETSLYLGYQCSKCMKWLDIEADLSQGTFIRRNYVCRDERDWRH